VNHEKTAVLVVTGVVAVLLLLTLVRSTSKTGTRKNLPASEAGVREGEGGLLPRQPSRRGIPAWHVVRPGDRLETLAQHYYGSREAWRRLFQANLDRLSDPDRLRVGLRLRLP